MLLQELSRRLSFLRREEGAESLEWLALVTMLVIVMVALSATLNSQLPQYIVKYVEWLLNQVAGA